MIKILTIKNICVIFISKPHTIDFASWFLNLRKMGLWTFTLFVSGCFWWTLGLWDLAISSPGWIKSDHFVFLGVMSPKLNFWKEPVIGHCGGCDSAPWTFLCRKEGCILPAVEGTVNRKPWQTAPMGTALLKRAALSLIGVICRQPVKQSAMGWK